ncbi:hypothetical protein OBBRIDRAFT_801701, partial [Obba rivulosa]
LDAVDIPTVQDLVEFAQVPDAIYLIDPSIRPPTRREIRDGMLVAGVIFLAAFSMRSTASPLRRILTAYTVAIFIATTIYFIAAAKWNEIEFVEDGSGSASFAVQTSDRMAVMKDTAITVNILLADSLITGSSVLSSSALSRFHGFAGCERPRQPPRSPKRPEKPAKTTRYSPNGCLKGFIVIGVALLVATSQPGTHFSTTQVVSLGTAVSLNIISTLLNSGRLLYHRYQVRHLGSVSSVIHTSVVMVLVESAAIYSISGLVYIPLSALNTPGQYPLAALFCAVSSIAPNTIVLCMALGVAVTKRSLTSGKCLLAAVAAFHAQQGQESA